MRGATRAAVLVGVIVIAVVLFIVLKPSDKNGPAPTTAGSHAAQKNGVAATAIPTVRVKGGKPVGGTEDLTFNKGDTVRFKVDSDVSDEVHVHGYDLHKDVSPGHPITFSFPAKIDGEFVVELERHGEQIASLKVNP